MNALEALTRCRRAWEATQPQLFWTDANLWGGLDERDAGAVLLVEPAAAPLQGHRGGLVSAFNGDGANPSQVARRPQKGA